MSDGVFPGLEGLAKYYADERRKDELLKALEEEDDK